MHLRSRTGGQHQAAGTGSCQMPGALMGGAGQGGGGLADAESDLQLVHGRHRHPHVG